MTIPKAMRIAGSISEEKKWKYFASRVRKLAQGHKLLTDQKRKAKASYQTISYLGKTSYLTALSCYSQR